MLLPSYEEKQILQSANLVHGNRFRSSTGERQWVRALVRNFSQYREPSNQHRRKIDEFVLIVIVFSTPAVQRVNRLDIARFWFLRNLPTRVPHVFELG